MDFSSPIFLIPIIAGSTFILAGLILLRFPPKKINGLYGYRTFSAMKSQDRWNFAQTYSAKELIKWGSVLALTSLSGLIVETREGIGFGIGLGIMLLFALIPIIRTERAIKSKFGKN